MKKCWHLLKEGINFWEEEISPVVEKEIMREVKKEISLLSTELLECQISEDSMQVGVIIAGSSQRNYPNGLNAKFAPVKGLQYMMILPMMNT